MVDRKDVASWLEGPNAQRPDADTDYPGRRLGMPQRGPGSVGRFGRRLVAIIIDWTLCQLIAFGMFSVPFGAGGARSFIPLAVFAVENLLLVATLGHTVGHRIMGLQVRSVALRPPNLAQVAVRTLLLCLFLPAMFWDRDGRGLHDKAAGTMILRRPRPGPRREAAEVSGGGRPL